MAPALRAFRHYRKHNDFYAECILSFFGDDEALDLMLAGIASKFGADPKELESLLIRSYEKSVERAFK